MHEEGKQPQNDTKIFGLTPVFFVSTITIVLFVIGSLVFREEATTLFGATRKWLSANFDWWFMDIVKPACGILPLSDCLPARQGAHRRAGGRSRILQPYLVRDALCSRHRHRATVFRCLGTRPTLFEPTPRR